MGIRLMNLDLEGWHRICMYVYVYIYRLIIDVNFCVIHDEMVVYILIHITAGR